MPTLRRLIRNTFLYDVVLFRRTLRAASEWTAQDAAMAELYGQFIRAGDLCFDIGANLGNRTKIFLRMGARVVALEPQLSCSMTLRTVFARRGPLAVVRKAVGRAEGVGELNISNANGVSSMSTDWVDAVKQSGRFPGVNWSRTRRVDVTTLDALITKYGMPRFAKIDVEGFELEVLSGLSKPIPTLSFEFTPEVLETTEACIRHLDGLGRYRFNYSLGESMQLALTEWVTADDLVARLNGFRGDTHTFGDVYARLDITEAMPVAV